MNNGQNYISIPCVLLWQSDMETLEKKITWQMHSVCSVRGIASVLVLKVEVCCH